ncbi:hypothetical protein [Actinotalea solisilvae]|uniref:hypothetical protein n=1 Tax=Actinotalea solisilvae TaxID=2072922 RepID=UPI001F1ED998|nr:hypothetical protein [Actinotalea solisilvae]
MNRRMQYSIAGAVVAVPVLAASVLRRRKPRPADGAHRDPDVDEDEAAEKDEHRGKHPVQGLVRLVMIALAVVAVVRELRLPPEQRTWHGSVARVVPYDFRRPTLARLRAANWNPEGKLVNARSFGVGWTLNAGRAVKLVRDRLPTEH